MMRVAAAGALAILAWLGAGGVARAWDLCNETSFVLEAAIGYLEEGALVTEGWSRVRPGECVSRGPEDPAGPRYVYARSSAAHRGGRREWQGMEPLCAGPGTFRAQGDANCEAQALETRFFSMVAPGAGAATFVEPNDYGDEAQLAGLQRLAGDAGASVTMERVSERNAVRAAETVLANEGGERPHGRADWIDWLEGVASDKREAEGLSVCNRAERPIWTAYARKAPDAQGRSRGWWSIAPERCVKLFGEALSEDEAYFLYAGQPGEEGDRMLAAATEVYCLAPARFAVTGREDCAGRGYFDGRFMPVATGGEAGVTVTLGPGDFEGGEAAEGPALRR